MHLTDCSGACILFEHVTLFQFLLTFPGARNKNTRSVVTTRRLFSLNEYFEKKN